MVSYLLPTGEGCGWVFLATPALRLWMEKFARIMGLRPDEACEQEDWPRMFFVQKGSWKKIPLAPPELPSSGWEAQALGSLRFWRHEALPHIICEIGNDGGYELEIINMWTSLYIIYLRAQDSGGLPIHAALLEWKGKGILLAGPADSGKSTSCGRLIWPWRALSDDVALVLRGEDKNYLAHPIPNWNDYLFRRAKKSQDVQRHVLISAIFFLEKADSDGVFPLEQGEAAILLNDSATYLCFHVLNSLDEEEKRLVRSKIFDNACELSRTVPAFILKASLTGRFWEEMEKVL